MAIDWKAMGSGKIRDRFAQLANTLAAFLQVRAQLFAIEAREASGWLGVKLLLGASAAFLLGLGYIMIWCALIPLLSRAWKWEWEYVCLLAAAPHLLAGGIMLWIAKEKFSKPLFEATLNELEKDQEWLARNLQSKEKKPS